ncbi:MAG: metallophosphoesterase [Myxococcota bacterium]|nr:metallophosphoesterase [Myxococcota bacterium]
MSYTLAHLSDWHVTSLDDCRLRDLANKRFLGWLSWRYRRRHRHRLDILRGLFKDLKRQAPDHVAVTGDLTNVALVQEFEATAHLLAELGPPVWISLVPGNHDAYVRMPRATTWDLWSEYMVSDEVLQDRESDSAALQAPSAAEFPTVRIRGPLALIGVCSAVPTGLGHASGRVGPAQLERLAATLAELRARELCCIVLIHHPVVDEDFTPRRRLVDSAAFRAVLREVGADLVLHGHGHRSLRNEIDGPEGPIPVIGVRSAAHVEEPEARRAQYHIFGIERAAVSTGSRFRFRLETRGYEAASGGFVTEAEEAL